MRLSVEVISFRMCERLVDYWISQRVEWHVDRGLKLNLDGSQCVQGRCISKSQI